jgi:hypothetical protein
MANDDTDDPITYRPVPNSQRPRVRRPENVNEVPVPLRAHIVTLARKGMPVAEIAARFELPLDWVRLLVDTPPGSTEH